jgi:large subunit ribosomal protein L13
MSEKILFVDGENAILGRLASHIAKKAINGHNIVLINAEKAVISGSKERILNDLKNKMKTHTLGNVEKGPVHYRRPDNYVRRVIRGMLPWKRPKGKEAFKRIKVYTGKPTRYSNDTFMKIESVDISKLKTRCQRKRVGDIMKEVGGMKE